MTETLEDMFRAYKRMAEREAQKNETLQDTLQID